MASLSLRGTTPPCVLEEDHQLHPHQHRLVGVSHIGSELLSLSFAANPNTVVAMSLQLQKAIQCHPFCWERSRLDHDDRVIVTMTDPLAPITNQSLDFIIPQVELSCNCMNYSKPQDEPCQHLLHLHDDGLASQSDTVYSLLLRCSASKDILLARNVHLMAAMVGLDSLAACRCLLIHSYATCGYLEKAIQVFGNSVNSDVHIWHGIIAACVAGGRYNHALALFYQMQDEGVEPIVHTFFYVLRACSNLEDAFQGMLLHKLVVHLGFDFNVLVGNALIGMYSKCGRLEEAHAVFRALPQGNAASWNIIISGYADHCEGSPAFKLFEEMQMKGVEPSKLTFSCMLKLCAKVGALDYGRILHDLVIRGGFQSDVVIGNNLLNMYSKCGNMAEACEVFDELQNRDVVSWGTMMRGYVQQGDGLTVLELFDKMQEEGIKPNKAAYLCLLNACASLGALALGKLIHNKIVNDCVTVDADVGGTLVDMYAKCGSLKEARQVFDNLLTRSVFIWNAVLSGYSQEEEHALLALELFNKMQQDEFKPNRITFLSTLKACGHIGALFQAMRLNDVILKYGLDLDVLVANALVDTYCKCGGLEEAQHVLQSLQVPNVASWGAMVAGYAHCGDCTMIRYCLEDMQNIGLKLDAMMFTSLLTACTHGGQLDEGKRYFKSMREHHSILPSIEHFNCMVGLFGRLGHLDEAMDLLESMPFKTDSSGWMTLLNACRLYGNLETASSCFERVLEIDSRIAAAYVVMSHIFADAGMWEDAKKLLAMKKVSGVWKKPGRAWVEVNERVHEFLVGDKTHPQSDIVYAKLESMMGPMKEHGYVPQVGLISEPTSVKVKEDALCGHSEKLAIVFGILSTPEGTTIRVRKNLRVCNDCHSASKIISKLEKRQIILRDGFRFHHFENGDCSCADHF